MNLFTIGFTKKSAETFFTKLAQSGAKRVVDVRLNNVSQLAAFAKRADLEYFLKAICGMEYVYVPELAPTQEILDAFKKRKGDWEAYEKDFLALLESRGIEDSLPKSMFEDACLLCSEHEPGHCHRRLIAEYLRGKWDDVSIVHIL
ncbi:MAG: DUF488 domain-containing protein [Candidatus Hydrogenedentes bacterium]|nr:DUF488 domain-containing protein [Candidatus Hydrogenedentota bacterium]